MAHRLDAVLATIDDANRADPNLVEDRPRALLEGQRATEWVAQLRPDAPESVLVAARAHHLTRWMVPRSSYPEGRAGYLRWRRDQKQRHADDMSAILSTHRFDPGFIERVQSLLLRTDLGTDPDAQLVEDAACLVFLETRFDDIVVRLDHDQLIGVVAKTLAKMSPAAIAATSAINLSEAGRTALAEAASRAEDRSGL
ncbi:MAG: DUF4202 domain-containing protein [Acidimicrobiia bacterium]|nr:DUF4202 domain-containing protein [Acidimicrobiia bacterium]MDH5237749.1 DUF4202 domain-containing protein [Acidimicrobiia bacterium]